MSLILKLCVFSVLVIKICNSANIMAYIQMPFYSHQVAFRPLWQELAKRGHKITLLTTDLMEENPNITQIDLSEGYKILEKYDVYTKLAEGENIFRIVTSSLGIVTEVLEYQLKIVRKVLEGSPKFDLVITELIGVGFAVAEKLDVPSIGVISMDAHDFAHNLVGNPSHPVANPDYDLAYSCPLSFKERVVSTVYSIVLRILEFLVFIPRQEQIWKKYFGQAISMEDAMKNASLVFINANPIFSDGRPLGPKTINVGGAVHFTKPKPLPKDIQEYLDNAQNGLIYFSLGTNIRSNHISNKTKNIILKVFAQLPYQILWKFEDENVLLGQKLSNIKIMKWVPQQDVIRHKNVKLFITQGGLQSMEEAIFNHIPMIGLPFFGDQRNNVKKMVAKGFGLSLDHATLEEEAFTKAILEVINNPRYKERTKELADLVLDQPMTGLEKAVWWTEYVIRNGRTVHFRSRSVDLPLYQYLLLDVIVVLFLIVFVTVACLFKLVQLLTRRKSRKHSRFVRDNDVKLKIS